MKREVFPLAVLCAVLGASVASAQNAADREAGKKASLVITGGDILQASSQTLSVFIDGRPFEPVNKQTKLFDKYQKRLNEVRSGQIPPPEPRK